MVGLVRVTILISLLVATGLGPSTRAQTPPPAAAQQAARPEPPLRARILRGEYGPYRANNDLLFYHLDIRIDPDKKFISGKNTIRFKMLRDDTRIQLDLYENLHVEKILLGAAELKYEREFNAVFVDFPEPLKAGRDYSIDFHYSGSPLETPAKARAPASGGRPRISGATRSRACASAWPSRPT